MMDRVLSDLHSHTVYICTSCSRTDTKIEHQVGGEPKRHPAIELVSLWIGRDEKATDAVTPERRGWEGRHEDEDALG